MEPRMRLGTRASIVLLRLLAVPPFRQFHVLFVGIFAGVAGIYFFAPWLTGAVLATIAAVVVWKWLIRRAQASCRTLIADYQAAFARGDADEVERLGLLFARLDHPFTDASIALRRGEHLLVRRKWTDAKNAFSEVSPAQLPAHARAALLNNLAYAMARLGEVDAAVHAERALAAAKEAKIDEASARSTLGAALVVAGRHAEALPLLEAKPEAEIDRSRNDRMYWLGCAYRALGRKNEAHEAFAIAASLDGWCTEEARAALADEAPFRT
jgi:tetratricopeptide (TPR) repeat protein